MPEGRPTLGGLTGKDFFKQTPPIRKGKGYTWTPALYLQYYSCMVASSSGESKPSVGNTTGQKRNVVAIVGVILVVVVVAIGIYFFWVKQNPTFLGNYPSLTPAPTVSATRISPTITPSVDKNLNQIILEKNEGWGPCPPGGEPCSQTTTLYASGRLVFKGNKNEEKLLSKELVAQIITQIRKSGIMNKDCGLEQTILDYSALYTFYLDGQAKTIQFPGCKDELKEIEKLIPDKTPSTMRGGS